MKQRKAERKQEAIERQIARDKRTPAQQMDHLDSILGFGKGAKRERERLFVQLDKGRGKPE